jgi:D-alanine--poly(phosphoribitol) ligase subunit 2
VHDLGYSATSIEASEATRGQAGPQQAPRSAPKSFEDLQTVTFTSFCAHSPGAVWLLARFSMLQLSVAEQVLSALEAITRTDEVRRDLDLELFELKLLDSLGVVELLVRISDVLGLDFSPSEFDREEWATPRKIVRIIEARVGP